MGWTDPALRESIRRYEQACVGAGCAHDTTISYVRYSTMFVDWRVGDSHTPGAPGPNHPRSSAATIESLTADVSLYRHELRQRAGLSAGAVQTYFVHAAQFVRWLDDRFAPGARLRAAGVSRSAPSATPHMSASQSAQVPGKVETPRPPRDLTWTWEGNVQAAVVTWLTSDEWTIERAADTKLGEHGVDIAARRGADRFLIEVKGYPQSTYARGDRAGEVKRWHPGAQARTYFGTGLHAVIILRDNMTDGQVALALPDMPTYRALLDQVRTALRDLGIRALLVSSDGAVRELRR